MMSFLDHQKYLRKRRVEEANDRFNIRTVGGVDVIVYGNVVVSRSTDNDLLERLKEFREAYINS